MRLLRNERGFTLVETMLSVVIVSIAMFSMFMIVKEIDIVDRSSKQASFAEKLIDPYLAYYQEIEVITAKENIYLSDVSAVNLVDVARSKNPSGIPKDFRDLDVVCVNDPSILKDGSARYMEFRINCEIDNQKVNKGRPYVIKKLIL